MRAKYPNYQMPGYAMVHDEDGMVWFTPWDQAPYGGVRDPDRPQDRREARVYNFDPKKAFNVPRIKKRTPQQRLDSLTELWTPDAVAIGQIPGRKDKPIRSAEDVRSFAAEMLGQAEAKFEESESKKTTRTAPSD